MKGTDCTPEQLDHAKEFLLEITHTDKAPKMITQRFDDIVRLLAWYGAIRFQAGRDGVGGTLEKPGPMVVSMKQFTEKQVSRSILHINQIIERESPHSAHQGLILVIAAVAGLLDVYAQPNEENPQGMADDPVAFRKVFAEMLATLPTLKKKIKLH